LNEPRSIMSHGAEPARWNGPGGFCRSENGLLLLQNIIEIYQNYSWKTEVLAASLRHPIHVIEAARMGADIATMPFKVIDQLFNHPLTDKGQAQFLADWAKSGRK